MIRPGLSWGPAQPAAPADTGYAAEKYLSDRTENATPAELTNMLFTEALRCIDTAVELFAADKHHDALRPIIKAQNIVVELRTALNPDAGDIALTLDSVYTWVYKNLLDANTTRTVDPLREARTCLGEIAEAWSQITTGQPA